MKHFEFIDDNLDNFYDKNFSLHFENEDDKNLSHFQDENENNDSDAFINHFNE